MMYKNKSWKKFLFTLRSGFINCYPPRYRGLSKKASFKLALYDCQISEFESEKYDYSAFVIKTQTDEEIILKANNYEEMLFWLNAVLKEKFLIEETINAIMLI